MLDAGAAPTARPARTEPENARPGAALFVFTPTAHPCGVETFTRAMVEALHEPPGRYEAIAVSGEWRDVPAEIAAVARSRQVVFNFPLNAWKKLIVQPLLLLSRLCCAAAAWASFSTSGRRCICCGASCWRPSSFSPGPSSWCRPSWRISSRRTDGSAGPRGSAASFPIP